MYHMLCIDLKHINNNMYELFFKKFNEKVPLIPEEVEIIKTYLTPK